MTELATPGVSTGEYAALMPGRFVKRVNQCLIEAEHCGPRAVLLRLVGIGDEPTAEAIVAWLDDVYARAGGVAFFFDSSLLRGYTPQFRSVWTQHVASHPARVFTVHVLATSTIVKLGLAVAERRLGGRLHVYEDAGPFGDALSRACAVAA